MVFGNKALSTLMLFVKMSLDFRYLLKMKPGQIGLDYEPKVPVLVLMGLDKVFHCSFSM